MVFLCHLDPLQLAASSRDQISLGSRCVLPFSNHLCSREQFEQRGSWRTLCPSRCIGNDMQIMDRSCKMRRCETSSASASSATGSKLLPLPPEPRAQSQRSPTGSSENLARFETYEGLGSPHGSFIVRYLPHAKAQKAHPNRSLWSWSAPAASTGTCCPALEASSSLEPQKIKLRHAGLFKSGLADGICHMHTASLTRHPTLALRHFNLLILDGTV